MQKFTIIFRNIFWRFKTYIVTLQWKNSKHKNNFNIFYI